LPSLFFLAIASAVSSSKSLDVRLKSEAVKFKISLAFRFFPEPVVFVLMTGCINLLNNEDFPL